MIKRRKYLYILPLLLATTAIALGLRNNTATADAILSFYGRDVVEVRLRAVSGSLPSGIKVSALPTGPARNEPGSELIGFPYNLVSRNSGNTEFVLKAGVIKDKSPDFNTDLHGCSDKEGVPGYFNLEISVTDSSGKLLTPTKSVDPCASGSSVPSVNFDIDLSAQAQNNTGNIAGKIYCEKSGLRSAAFPFTTNSGVQTLKLSSGSRSFDVTLQNDGTGDFSVSSLPTGPYVLSGKVSGISRNSSPTELLDACVSDFTAKIAINKGDNPTFIIVYDGNANEPKVTSSDPGVLTQDAGPEPSCESEGGSFSWLMCPALELVSGILNFIDSQLNSLLNLPDSYYKCQPDGSGCTVKNAWSRMRNLAYIILIPIMLVMVISTALGFKFVDAYTVKRAMPRLLAAVIFISLSLPIVTIMADIANGVGKGIMGLILGAVTGDNANNITLASLFDPGLASGGLLTAGLVVAGGIAIGLIGAILLFGLTAVASILVLFFVMALRQMLLVTLMIVAPLAILSWIFPGNDKLWKIWKESFTKLLLLYPIVMLLIASGKAFAYIVDGVGSGFINTILILVAYIGPYFLIKGTFKMAGSIFGNLSGMVNDRGKGVFDRLGKARQKKYQDKWHKARSGRYFNRASEGSLKNWANRKIENISNQGLGGVELRPTVRKARMKAALDERAFDHAMEASEKLPGARAHFASDVLMLAGLEGQGDRTRTMNYFRKKGISEHEAMLNTESVLAMRNAMGAEAYELAAIAKLPGTGTAFEERDTSRWHQHVGRVSHGNAGLEASLVAAGKSGFRNAQRTEVSEAGFSDHMQAVKMARNARTQKELDEITNFIVDKSYEGGGPAAVVYSRNAKVANMFAEAMERSIIKAERSGDHRIEMRAKAAVAAVHEQLGQAKQVVSTVLGDRFFGKEVQYKVPVVQEKIIGEGSEKTIIRDTEYVDKTGSRLDEIQSHKGDRVFQETKFEYGQVSAEIADRLRASQPQQGQNQPGQVKPPLGGIPGQP